MFFIPLPGPDAIWIVQNAEARVFVYYMLAPVLERPKNKHETLKCVLKYAFRGIVNACLLDIFDI